MPEVRGVMKTNSSSLAEGDNTVKKLFLFCVFNLKFICDQQLYPVMQTIPLFVIYKTIMSNVLMKV